jgi:hypothetical protein
MFSPARRTRGFSRVRPRQSKAPDVACPSLPGGRDTGIVLAAALAILLAYRKVVEGSVDELVHVSDATTAAISKQRTTAHQLEQLDRVVKIMWTVVILYGLGLCCLYVYQAFVNGGKTTP